MFCPRQVGAVTRANSEKYDFLAYPLGFSDSELMQIATDQPSERNWLRIIEFWQLEGIFKLNLILRVFFINKRVNAVVHSF